MFRYRTIKKTIFAKILLQMKRYFGLLCCLVILNACDDGDMVFESFNFNDARSADCGLNSAINTVFKINDNEALILKIDAGQTFLDQNGNPYTLPYFPFRNKITAEGDPKIYTIGPNNRVIYRVFNGAVSNDYFCSQIPPVSPSVIDESATSGTGGGTIEINTRIIEADYSSVAAIRYQHVINLKNVTFNNSQGATTYEAFSFGTYEKGSNVDFGFSQDTDAIQRCDSGKLIRFHDRNIGDDPKKEDLNEVLEFTISDAELLSLDLGDTPLLLSDTRKLTYKIYSNDVNRNFVCSGTVGNLEPAPVLYEEFTALNGTDAVGETPATGKITITKTQIAGTNNFTYNILFSAVKFKDTDSETTFTLNTHIFGDYVQIN